MGTTVLLLILISRSIEWPRIIELFQKMHWGWVLAACAAIVVVRVLMAVRWRYVLASEGIDEPLGSLVSIIFVSHFVGHLLPGSLGIEAMRGYEIVRDHGRATSVTATVLIDRVNGICAMLLLGLVGTLVAQFMGAPTGLLIPILLLNALAIGGWLALIPIGPRIAALRPFQGALPSRIWSKLMVIVETVSDVTKLKKTLLPVTGVSLVVQLARCASFYALYRSLGTDVPFASFLIFIPLTFVVSHLPVSIGGLGVREGTLAYLFSTVGVASEVSVGVGLISYVLQIGLSLPSMLFWAIERSAPDSHPVESFELNPQAVMPR